MHRHHCSRRARWDISHCIRRFITIPLPKTSRIRCWYQSRKRLQEDCNLAGYLSFAYQMWNLCKCGNEEFCTSAPQPSRAETDGPSRRRDSPSIIPLRAPPPHPLAVNDISGIITAFRTLSPHSLTSNFYQTRLGHRNVAILGGRCRTRAEPLRARPSPNPPPTLQIPFVRLDNDMMPASEGH